MALTVHFQGSFVIRVFAAVKGDDGNSEKEYYLEHYWVLNHRNTIKCANCLTHLDVASHFPLTDVSAQDRDK